MIVSSHTNYIFNSVSYRIGDILIDPGDEWEGFVNVDTVILTHIHFDHIYGLNRVVELNPQVKIFTNDFGVKALVDAKLNMSKYQENPFVLTSPGLVVPVLDGNDVFTSNGIKAHAVFSPGHNPSCITWLIDDAIFTGDSYIPGLKVVTNLPYSDKQLSSISESKIIELAKNKRIFPGHNLGLRT